jgi:hypothetical protein
LGKSWLGWRCERWSVAHQSSSITHDRRFLAVWQEIVVKFYLPPQPCRNSKIASKSAKSVFDFLRLARSWLKILAMSLMVCYRLWKWYVTAYGNGMLPLYATQVSYPRQYATALSNRLWKWYVTALCNPSKLPKTICNRFKQPLMEMVCYRFMQPC